MTSFMHTGRLLILVWSFVTLNFAAFYSSNLRVILIAREYEKPVDEPLDVIARDQTLYLADITYLLFFS